MEQRIEHRNCCYPYIMMSEKKKSLGVTTDVVTGYCTFSYHSGKLTSSVNNCFMKALHAKYRLTQTHKKKTNNDKAREKEVCSKLKNALVRAMIKKILTFPTCVKCGKAYAEGCRKGTNLYFKCGKECHFVSGCAAKQLKITDEA